MSDARDTAIDARLREVPLPSGLADRVTAESLFDDAAIDALLARVDAPTGLLDRVRRACRATHHGLLDTPPSEAATASGRPTRSAFTTGRRWLASAVADLGAVAAALAIVAAMFFAGIGLSHRMAAPIAGAPRGRPAAGRPRTGSAVAGSPRAARAAPPADTRHGPDAAATDRADGEAIAFTVPQDGVTRPAHQGESAPPGRRSAAAVPEAVTDSPAAIAGAVAGFDGGVRASPAIADWSASGRAVQSKGVRVVTLPTVSRPVPRIKGFDTVFEMTYGEAPFVDPALNPTLAVDHPPLSLRTDAFDTLTEKLVREGAAASRRSRGASRRGPVAGGLAVEELLAALPQAASSATATAGPQATASLATGIVALTGVRSLRPNPGSTLVEITATPPLPAGFPGGRPGGAAAGDALDTLLVIDQSAAAAAPSSWLWMCRGLARIASCMGADDRLSVIVCGERPRLAALRADATAVSALVAELEAEPAAPSADVDAALRLVGLVARREGPPRRMVVAARAESLDRCRTEGRAALVAWRGGDEASPAVRFVLVDPQEPPLDATLRSDDSGRAGRVAADPIAIGRALLSAVSGRPTLAAGGCRLAVAFDPRVVGSYRIVGYRQTAADAVLPGGPAAVDLHAGEAVRVVYEVVPRPGEGAGRVPAVIATLTWTPPGASRPDQRQGTWGFDVGTGGLAAARRRDLPPPRGCELLLAVACGELASGSPHAEPRRQTLAAAAALVERWKTRGDVTPTGAILIDALQRLGLPAEGQTP